MGREMAMGTGRLGGGNGDREMGRGAMVRGEMGNGRSEGSTGRGEGARRGRISQMDMMECLGGCSVVYW